MDGSFSKNRSAIGGVGRYVSAWLQAAAAPAMRRWGTCHAADSHQRAPDSQDDPYGSFSAVRW